MPTGSFKNALYGVGLHTIGKRSPWQEVQYHSAPQSAGTQDDVPVSSVTPQSGMPATLKRILKRNHVVGTSLCLLRGGEPAECYTAGFARCTTQPMPVTPESLFRTASIAKLATALLVFRLQTLGKLDVAEDVSDLLGYPVRNPNHPQKPITLGMLLSHTSSIVDSPAYFASFAAGVPLRTLLNDPAAFSTAAPGERFRYSNLAAGVVGSLLEARMEASFEALVQEYLFRPMEVAATFDLSTLASLPLADSYRVLPCKRSPAFDAVARIQAALSLAQPNPELHYLLASGSLFISATGLVRLLFPLVQHEQLHGKPFLNEKSLAQMKTPCGQWPDPGIPILHSMGLLVLNDPAVSRKTLYGHQGFAYGAVNGVFFTEDGDGFAMLNSGASEQRKGHLAVLNRDLIRLLLP